MKVKLVQAIRTASSQNGVRSIHKCIETEIKPAVGDEITNDPLWKDPYEYKVNNVMLDFSDNEIRVTLDDLIVGSKADIEKYEDLATKYHGWEKGGFLFG